MSSMVHRVANARAWVEEALRDNPSGLPGISLIDRMEHWGVPEHTAMEILREMEDKGAVRLEAGHWVLSRP